MKIFDFQNFTCKLGQNATENWELLDAAKEHHIFFHLASFPSCYVILECDTNVSLEMIQIAANICKNGTKYRNLNFIKVDYCRCDNIYKGDKVGSVHYHSNRKVKQIESAKHSKIA
jgi:predicted ribosome quality control (RQC) complex YloA/Tae2 family protein